MSSELAREVAIAAIYETHKCYSAEKGTFSTWDHKAAEEILARYAAQVRLEEAEWWEHLAPDCDLPENQPCRYCERIAELERAAK